MRKYSLLLVAMLVVAGVLPILFMMPSAIGEFDYPSKGVDYIHRGVAQIENDPEFTFLWRAHILGMFDEFSGPIAVGDKVWIANKGDKIFRCLDLRTGTTLWSYQLNTYTDGTPLWFENKVYVGTGNGASRVSGSLASLYCFNADNGDNLWRFDGYNNNYYASSPWVNSDNKIIYWVDGRYLRAFRYDNGEVLWSDDLGVGNHPFIGTYYNGVCYSPPLIRAYGAENGTLLWSISGSIWDGGITVDNENVDNVVLYVSGMSSVNPDNGDIYWSKSLGSTLTIPTVWENKIYTSAYGYVSSLICLRKDNGDIVWNVGEGYTQIYTTPVVLPSGKVVYGTQNGWLKVRDANNGNLLWSYYLEGQCFSSAVAVVDNYILISSDSGDLWCFGPGNVEPNKPENLLVSNLDSPVPSFSAIFTDNDLGDYTASAKIQVGTSEGDNDVWTSDWITIGKNDNNQRSSYVSWLEVASGATYYAQMKFKDAAGNESPWSDSVTFTQTNPYADNLLAEGKVSPQDVTTFSPEFSFRYNDNFGDNSSMFRIQVASMWDNQQSVNVENGSIIEITYAGAALSRGVWYLWRVKVRDNENAYSNWSDYENFMICNPNADNLRVENQISPQRLTTTTPNFSFGYMDNAGENSSERRIQVWGSSELSESENVYPSEDSYTDSDNPDTNYGSENYLEVYAYDWEPYKQAFIKFDFENIPTWATINSATLWWYVQNTDYIWNYGYVGSVEDDSWTENTITWNNQPSAETILEFDFESFEPGWRSFDLTSYIQEQAAGDDVASIGIANYYNEPPEESMVIASRENSPYAPYLEVSYEHYLWDNQQIENVENNSIITATYAGDNLQRGNTYFWRARVQDNIGFWSDWSDNENFRINQLPTVENQKTEEQVDPTGLATFTPAFSWNYSDNDNDAQSNYQIQVGVSENDNSMWDNTGATLTQITYSGNALARGVTYYVRVHVKDNYEWSSWANGTFKLSQSPTVTVGSSTIELKLLEAGDAPVITTSTFTIKLTVGTRTENLLIYYAFVEETPSIQTDGSVAPFYFSISTTNSGAITSATITFNVPKSWVQANDIVLSTLTVWRNTDGTWRPLPTTLVGDNTTYYYLEATTTGFSLFCVTGQKKAVAPSETPMAAPTPQTSPSDQQMQQVVFIAALGILIVVVMLLASSYMRHKKRR